MATNDNPELFCDDDMRRRYDTVYEFLANEGTRCGVDKTYIIAALHHVGEALHMNTQSESLWKAYVLLDVLIDRWDECVGVLVEELKEEATNGCDG